MLDDRSHGPMLDRQQDHVRVVAMSQRIDLRVDVTIALRASGEAGLAEDLETAVTVFAPEPGHVADPPIVFFGFPGGEYARGYYAIEQPGFSGYDQAAYHTARGAIFVACDHLGVGDSSQPSDPASLTYENIAAANHAAVTDVMARVRAGDLVRSIGPLPDAHAIGMGQSMGGCFLIVQQANHGTFEGIAVLGFSAIQTVLPTPPGQEAVGGPQVARGERVEELDTTLSADAFRYAFHLDDVPGELVEADMQGYPVRDQAPMWGSATVPLCAATMLSPGVVADEAARVTVPVLVAVGERDVVPDPQAEAGAYSSSPDVTLYVQPRAAHMHNFAGTRRLLWDELDAWARKVTMHS
jgi:pimeloyl-ACP methyl ester carboxylesterase